jgi:hypothetical protein
MKKSTLAFLLLIAAVSSIFFSANAASTGTWTIYFSDPAHTDVVGERAYGSCRDRWGITSIYKVTFNCSR